ncbi:MAG: efflux transporter outer membrane subunit [Betaproteobacteria bacterium]|nr:efflux transporter outer membrane subunit [Betaproteobacteria bacterium]
MSRPHPSPHSHLLRDLARSWSAPLHTGLVLAAALALTACASTAVPPAGPTALVQPAPTWQAAAPAGGTEPTMAGPAFDDPLLPPLTAAAQAAGPTLAAVAARVARARASRVAAGAALQPRVDATGGVGRGRQQLASPVATQASIGVQAAWEIDLFGAGAAGRGAAQARLDSARAAAQGAQVALAAEVASSYVALRSCEAQLVPTQADATSRAETTRLTELSARAGFTAPADAALVRATAAQSRGQLVAQRAACDSLVKGLVALTDLPEPELRQRLAARTARLPVAAPLAVPALPAALLARRPDIAEAARNVMAAAGERAQAQARERPQITLSGSLAGVTLRTGQESSSGTTWTLGPLAVNFPLFDGGARAAATAAAAADYDEAVAAYRAQVRLAVREVEQALVALQSSAEREADALLAAQDFEASLRATEARQRGGLASLFDLEAARRNALAAQAALIDLQRERAQAWITLYRAMGGGFDETLLARGDAR